MTFRASSILAVAAILAGPLWAYAQAPGQGAGLTGNPLTQQGDHAVSGGRSPTISAGCGTGAVVTGTDTAGHVLLGTTTSNPCTITFATSYTQRPTCSVDGETAAASYTLAANGASMAITNPVDGQRYYWQCIGRPN